jgi:hypothetical protein
VFDQIPGLRSGFNARHIGLSIVDGGRLQNGLCTEGLVLKSVRQEDDLHDCGRDFHQ